MKKNIFNSRRFKHGTLATVMTIVFVAAVVLVNVIATILLDKFPLSLDLTKDQSFQMADDSKEFLKNLDTEVRIHVLMDENNLTGSGDFYVTQIYTVLKQCTQYSSKVSLDFIDFVKHPTYGQNADGTYKFGQALQSGNIVIESDLRHKIIDSVNDLVDYDSYGYTITGSHAESDILGAIVNVTDKNPVKVANLVGFQEVGVPGLVSVLEQNSYTFEDVNILTQDIPEDADILLIAAPTLDYSQKEIDKIEKFLANNENYGKNLIYIASPQQETLPILEGYLKNDWNLEIGNGVVMETDPNNIYAGFGLDLSYTLQTLTGNLFADNIPEDTMTFVPAAVPVKGLNADTTTAIISSADTCILQPDGAGEDWDYTKETQQSFDTAVASTRSRYKDGTDYVESKVIAIGSTLFFDEQVMKMSYFNNGDFSIDMFNTLAGKDSNTLNILDKTENTDSLGVTDSVVSTIRLIFMIIVPIVTFAIGLIVWLRRKNK